MKPVRVKIAGKLRTVPESVVRRGHTKSWVRRQAKKYAKPKLSFNKTFNKRRLKEMPASAFGPDPPRKKRWNQK